MRVLQISDLHFSGKDNPNLLLLENVLKQSEKIDFCVFSGDLIDKGTYNIEKAYNKLKNLLLNYGISDIYLTCGNHDIQRNFVYPIVKDILLNMDENKINDFVTLNQSNQFTENLKHMKNFIDLSKTLKENLVKHDNLYTIYEKQIDDNKVAIININLSWTAFDNDTYGKLLFPSTTLHEIVNNVSKFDFKIANIHYNPKFLRLDLQSKFEKMIIESIDCLFIGHTHKFEQNSIQYTNNGIFVSTSTMLKYDKSSEEMGCKILDFDLKTYDVKVNTIFMKGNEIIIETENFEIPKDEKKKFFSKINTSIKAMIEKTNFNMNVLFLMNSKDEKENFKDLFICPILKENSFSDLDVNGRKVHNTLSIEYSTLQKNDNFIIHGKDKSGKSAILYNLMYDMLLDFNKNLILPIFVDLKEVQDNSEIDIDAIIRKNYNLSLTEIRKLKQYVGFKLLVDNYEENRINGLLFTNQVKNLIKEDKLTFVITTSTNIDSDFKSIINDVEITKLFIQSVTRNNIRELTKKWNLKCDYEEAISKIESILNNMNIGVNFWTVSMFLFVLQKNDDFKFRNNSELVDFYIDKLLDKENLAYSHSAITFESLKIYLSELSYYLYSTKNTNGYKLKYSELCQVYEELQEKNLRFVVNSKEIIDYLINKGVICIFEKSKYGFRMSGIFEYFLAYYMTRNISFKDFVMKDYHNFISFRNEIELYSGMKKNDVELLKYLYNVIQNKGTVIKQNFNEYNDYEKIIQTEDENLKQIVSLMKEYKNEILPLSEIEIDTLEDNNDPLNELNTVVEQKSSIEINSYNNYCECLELLGRVFRNSDDINDVILLTEIFRFLLNESCMSIYFVLNDFLENLESGSVNKNQIKKFNEFLACFSPIFSHSIFYDMIYHPTITKYITNEIADLSDNFSSSEVKLFVLYFMLIEADIRNGISKIDELINKSKHWNILNSIFMKLLTYVTFKTNGNTQLIDELKLLINNVYEKMYPQRKQPKDDVNLIISNLKLKGIAELPTRKYNLDST